MFVPRLWMTGLCAMLFALAALADVADVPDRLPLAMGMEWFADHDSVFDDALQLMDNGAALSWNRSSEEAINIGFSPSPHWFRVAIPSVAQGATRLRYLEIPQPMLDSVKLSVFRDGNHLQTFTMGDKLPFDHRPLDHRHFVVPLELSYESPTQIYVRVQTEGGLQMEPILWHPDTFAEYNRRDGLALGIYYGIMLVMFAYNLFLYFATRDQSYLFYISFVATFTLFVVALQGDAYQFLWPRAGNWSEAAIPFFICMTGVTSSLFTNSFLQLKKYRPRARRVFLGIVVISAIMSLLSLFMDYGTSIRFASGSVIPIIVVILYVSISMWLAGHTHARYFVLAWVALLVGTASMALARWGLLPWNMITEHGTLFGAVAEVVLLSLALADRINSDRKARFEAQSEALQIKQTANVRLEARVHERTQALQRAISALETLSNTDQLTQLNNRRLFDQRFHEEYRRAHRQGTSLSVILVDIDHFKLFNDTHGHLVGDYCLREVAKALSECIVRAGDVLARFGGEEFIVLLSNTDIDGARIVAENLRAAIESLELSAEGQQLHITISLGISHLQPTDVENPELLIQHADEALYLAKERGRNRVCAYQETAE